MKNWIYKSVLLIFIAIFSSTNIYNNKYYESENIIIYLK